MPSNFSASVPYNVIFGGENYGVCNFFGTSFLLFLSGFLAENERFTR